MSGRHIAREGGAVEPVNPNVAAIESAALHFPSDAPIRHGLWHAAAELAAVWNRMNRAEAQLDTLRAQLEAAEDRLTAAFGAFDNAQLQAFIDKYGVPVPLISERDSAIARAEAAEADAARLNWLWRESGIEGFVNVPGDIHHYAQDVADENERDEANKDDYDAGFRLLIDAARKQAAP